MIGEQIERRQDIWVLDSGGRRDDRSRSVESVALMLSVLASGACTPRLSRVLSIVRIVVRLSRDGRVVVVVVGHDPCGEDLLGLLVARIEVHVVLVIVLRRVVHQWGRVGIVQVQEAVILEGLEGRVGRKYRKRDKKKVNKLNIDKDDGERFTGLLVEKIQGMEDYKGMSSDVLGIIYSTEETRNDRVT